MRTRSSGRFWFNTGLKMTEGLRERYRFAGWLLGQCFANRCVLLLPMPEVLFEKLLKGSAFQAGHPEISHSSRKGRTRVTQEHRGWQAIWCDTFRSNTHACCLQHSCITTLSWMDVI